MLVRECFPHNICIVHRDKGKEHDKLRAGVNIYKKKCYCTYKQCCINVMIIQGTMKMVKKYQTY